jgi:magnesium transporter
MMLIGTWYGMNFEGMPELTWPHGYLGVTLVTLASTVAAYLYLRRKGWL